MHYQAADLMGFAAIHSVLIIQKICYNGEYPQTLEVQTYKVLQRCFAMRQTL